jgi:hypothetical protein
MASPPCIKPAELLKHTPISKLLTRRLSTAKFGGNGLGGLLIEPSELDPDVEIFFLRNMELV